MWAVVRIRGRAGVQWKVRDTLKMLRLHAPQHCILLPETPDYEGMLRVVKDYITWGEVEEQTLAELLRHRLRMSGDERLNEAKLKELTGYGSFEELAKALIENRAKLKDFQHLRPVLKLRPPSKGFKSTRLPWPKGDLGYRGRAINELLRKMM